MKTPSQQTARIIAMVAAAGMGLSLSTPALAGTDGFNYGPGMMWGGGWIGMMIGPLMMLLFIIIATVLVVLVIRWLGGAGGGYRGGHGGQEGPAPLEILKARFARGEIDKDEYEERRRVLGE